MPILPPTVLERLARCGNRIYVNGLVSGADVVVTVGGVEHSFVAAGSSHVLNVPPLNPLDAAHARQDDGSGFSNESAGVVVEDAESPPAVPPLLPGQVGYCSHCVHVSGLVPGCEVELLQGGATVGAAAANRHGYACVPVKLERRGQDDGGVLHGKMIVCGADSPLAATPLVADPPLAKPAVGSPVYGCQRVIPLSELNQGNRVRLESDTRPLGTFCSCWQAVNVHIGSDLVVGEKVRAQPFWDSDACKQNGPWSEWREVVAPDEGIKPVLLPALIENDQTIRVDNQIAGAELMIQIRANESATPTDFGPRPANDSPEDLEISLAEPLIVNHQVRVVQTLCGHSEASDWVTVLPLPPEVFAPVVRPPLYACGGAVQVSNLHPGAVVRVYQNDFVIGIGWAGLSSSISITANPRLAAGAQIHAVQWVGGVESPPSAAVTVQDIDDLYRPRVLEPVAFADNQVWVSGVTPGARVSIFSGGTLLGEANAAESIMTVPVNAVPGDVKARTALCEVTSESPTVQPITSPCAVGPFVTSGEEERSYPDYPVPANPDGGDFVHPITGRLYFPADAMGNFKQDATNLPLVIVAHGYWPSEEDSYLGYGYLARHLARWGMLVYSLNFDVVNERTSPAALQQASRGYIILEAIRAVLNDPDIAHRIDTDRIGVVGHSMSGEGVVAAQDLNLGSATPFSIRGVVSIAPTHWRPDLQLRETRYLQLLGSMDQLVSSLGSVTGVDPVFGGFRIYDRAWRNKTHCWIYDARHNGFNHNWATGLNLYETGIVDDSLSINEHKTIAACMINAFFLDALKGESDYAGYLQGIILPRSVRGFRIYTQHHTTSPTVLDDFGDADNQLGHAAEAPLDKNSNRAAQGAQANGAGMDHWDDVEHVGLTHSVHDTRGLELTWVNPQAEYRSDTGGFALSPMQSLSLRVSQFYEDSANNLEGADLDLFVALHDGSTEAVVRLGAVGTAPFPDSSPAVLSVMRSLRLPLDAFEAVNPGINLGSIQTVTFYLDARGSGHVLIDDIEFV